MRIYLIGMPGSGKSTIAKALSNELSLKYIDTDDLIEQEALMFISDIFSNHGEEVFRNLETRVLSTINEDNIVVATGGGIVLKRANKELMDGLVIYLDTPLEQIKQRLKTTYIRPLLQAKSLEQLYDERWIKYQGFADIVVSNKADINTTVSNIIKNLKEQGLL